MSTALEPVTGEALAVGTPMELLRIAMSQNADLDKLKQLMDLQERWEKNEARKSFVAAMSAFKAEAIVIIRDKTNNQYNSKYVSLGNLVTTVTPFLSRHGLSVRWELDQSEGIQVTCIVTHCAGHSESVSMNLPPDKSGAKNPIQEIKSAITYGKGCTFESATGLAATDANIDDDGNGASGKKFADLQERIDWIGNCRNTEELQKVFTAAYKDARTLNDQGAMKELIKAKDKRRGELR
jgi:hypothetical protein